MNTDIQNISTQGKGLKVEFIVGITPKKLEKHRQTQSQRFNRAHRSRQRRILESNQIAQRT
ncbi:MAG: hypothetical protein FWG84_03485 [Bacteroidales bacterium]|nr:hypothetical protein [Bacteroidales bacterium]